MNEHPKTSSETIWHSEDALTAIAKHFNLDLSKPQERCLAEAGLHFVEQGYDEAIPLFRILEKQTASDGHPMVCAWCGRLHWRPDHQAETEKYAAKKNASKK